MTRWRDEKGQTTTEYLMIAGLIIAVFLSIYPEARSRSWRKSCSASPSAC